MNHLDHQPNKKKRWIAVGAIALAAGGFAAWKLSHPKPLEIAYREAKPEHGKLDVTILATGTVQPENRLEIKPPIAGRVETVIAKEGQRVRKGQILAWMSSTERAALLDAARAKGPDEVKKWEELYRPTPIIAPIAGMIILRNVESGQTFTGNDSVFVMSDRLTVKAQVDETDISQISLKQKATMVLDAYPKLFIPGHVDQIAYDAKTVNSVTTYVVDVLPEETPEVMRSGMTANVTFLVASKEDALIVPSEAVKAHEDSRFVLIREAGKEAPAERTVEVGLVDGKRTEITKGLNGDEVLLIAQVKGPGNGRPQQASNPFSPMGQPRKR